MPTIATDSTLHLSNSQIAIALRVPGAPDTYCGNRFTWAGIIDEVSTQGQHLFGPWRPGTFPLDEHDHVTGTAGEFGMGIAGMPAPLGYDEAPPGETFVKIGVGVLRRPDEAPYSFMREYERLITPPWQVEATRTRVEMRQTLTHGAFGYAYTYTLELVPGTAGFVTRHRLVNTGARTIHQTHYSHNFIVINRQPIGPAYSLHLPFAPADASPFAPGAESSFVDNALCLGAPLKEALFAGLSGFGDTRADNQFTVRCGDAGHDMTLQVTGDQPIVRFHLFIAPGAICPEPFVELNILPGDSSAWAHRYDIEVDPEVAGQ